MIFDGKKFAEEIEADLKIRIAQLPQKLKLAIWLEDTNLVGKKYVEKKMAMAGRLGIDVVLNKVDDDADGIVVQLPHSNSKFLINLIDLNKDVDGLREDSPFKPAVVKAVIEILGYSLKDSPFKIERTVLVGCKGFVGRKLSHELRAMDDKLVELDIGDDLNKLKDADVVISATGQAGLIKPEMVKEGVIAIDVGYPRGDFDPQVASKASFFTPVPGGVGPVTVVMLFANLLESVHD